MELVSFLNSWNRGKGRTRVIDKEGNVIREHYNPYGGISIDFRSVDIAIKEGTQINYASYDPDTFRFFK